MNYIRSMAIRIALVAGPALAAIGLVALLNALNASGGIVVVTYTAVAAAMGIAIGRSVDRLPGEGSRQERRIAPRRRRT
jgi:hypothetical protein